MRLVAGGFRTETVWLTRACSHYWVEYDIIGGWNLQKLNTNE